MATTSFIAAMWGSNPYARVEDIKSVSTVSELTHRFVHGEIQDAEQYKDRLDVVVKRIIKEETSRCKDNTIKIKRACMLQINKRLYGKTPLEMLISFESFILLAEEHTPEAAYRLSLKRTFEGIFALHQAAGRFIDSDYTNSPLRAKYGTPDLEVNIAGLCAFFPVDVYDETVAADGSLKFTIKTRGTFVARQPCTPLVSSTIFDFIKLLWPNTYNEPELDPSSMKAFSDVLQDRQNKSIDKVLRMFDRSVREELLQIFDNGSTQYTINAGEVLGVNRLDLGVRDCVDRMMALRRFEVPLTDTDIAAIAAADAIALPIVTEWMNRARVLGVVG